MSNALKFLALLGASSLLFSTGIVHAQDAAPPPPGYGYQGGGAPPPPDQAPPPDQGGGDQGASFQQFYDQLGNQGEWIQTQDYGYVFQPAVQDPNWAPYTDGHWVYSDVGWTWVSAEPWGWATYHYGRWANINGAGWVWVPGYQWAPAWVSWRYGGGYCGWAPLPPASFVGVEYGSPGIAIGIGFHFGGDVDLGFNIGPGCYSFVPVNCMGYGNYNHYYIDRSRNYTVINHTTNITNIYVNNGASGFNRVSVKGPRIEDINAHSTQRVQTVSLAQANGPGRATVHGNQLAVYAPHVNASSARTARPANVGQTINNVSFNHGDSISKPLEVTRSIQGRAPSQEAIAAAQKASTSAPPTAKVAHEGTVEKTTFHQPLTSMQPVSELRHTPATQGNAAVNNTATHNASANIGEQPTATRKSTAESSALTGQQATGNTQHAKKPVESSSYTGEQPATTTLKTTTEASPYTGQQSTTTQHAKKSTESSSYTGEGGPVHQPATHTTSSPYESSQQSSAAERQQTQRTESHVQQQQSAPVQHYSPPQGGGAPPQHAAPQPQQRAAPQGGGQQAGHGNAQGKNEGQNNQNGH